ncbi:MAG: hypothetical protein IPK74_06335 [Deltaproteobacteria bacterium]|nr:hypothetical protein [Deltaproteobacteria bacterium]
MAFTRKFILVVVALAVVAATWIVTIWPRARETEPDGPAPVVRQEPRSADMHGTTDAHPRAKSAAPISPAEAEARRVARARWEERRARILAAHATPAERDAAPETPKCVGEDCPPDPGDFGGDVVFASFVGETQTLTRGCEELMGEKPQSVRISARLVGAPGVGTIVDNVTVTGPGESMDELTQCLQQGMYTLELGDAAANFERNATLVHGLLDEVAGQQWLSPEELAGIRQQMIDGGLDPAADPMVAVNAGEPAAEP